MAGGAAKEVYRVTESGGRLVVNVANLGRKPYIPLHELYGKFDCPIVDSYSNKIDWISIFD